MSRPFTSVCVLALMTGVLAADAAAQGLGTFRWQLQPYCNVVTFVVTQNGGVYNLDGHDDQCGAATRAPATGIATLNPDGTIGFGFSIVVSPGASPVHVAAAIGLVTLSGTWRDHTSASGSFVFTPGAGTGGDPRPVATTTQWIPNLFALRPDGGFLATGTHNTGSIPASGAGTRLMWHPAKSAFRAGRVAGSQWNDQNVGVFSLAVGSETVASGQGSVAAGLGSVASASGAVAFGVSAIAGGAYAFAAGIETASPGFAAVAFGNNTAANGVQSAPQAARLSRAATAPLRSAAPPPPTATTPSPPAAGASQTGRRPWRWAWMRRRGGRGRWPSDRT